MSGAVDVESDGGTLIMDSVIYYIFVSIAKLIWSSFLCTLFFIHLSSIFITLKEKLRTEGLSPDARWRIGERKLTRCLSLKFRDNRISLLEGVSARRVAETDDMTSEKKVGKMFSVLSVLIDIEPSECLQTGGEGIWCFVWDGDFVFFFQLKL